MDSDDRFKHLAYDPRFKTLRKKQRKIQIDERFKSMFTDEKFGRRENLEKFYQIADSEVLDKKDGEHEKHREKLPEDDGDKEEEEKDGDDDNEVNSDQDEESKYHESADEEDDDHRDTSEQETPESELSSSSDESESDDEVEAEGEQDPGQIHYDWQPLDHDAERTEIKTKRLAILNLDWNNLDINDIYVLLNSIRQPLSVKLYISEFGKERLAKEDVDGPDLPEIDEVEEEINTLEEHMQGLRKKANQYEDADEMFDAKNEAIRERLRQYQLAQMKYYYAIAEFDSIESAQAVYKELDGIEYEGSSLELDLRFVPDDVEFDQADVKAECDKPPDLATYKAPQFIASALQQTTVKFTWDETDVKRQQKLRKAYTKEELERDDLEAYLASDTESEDENGDDKNKYRELLKELDENDEKKKKVDVDIEWDDDSDNVDAGKDGEDDDDGEEEEEEEVSDNEEKDDKEDGEDVDGGENDKDQEADESEHDAGLDLLVLDPSERENFKFNPDDERFKAIYESGLYNIDPSHPRFKRTEAFNQIAERKREKRRKVK